MNILKRIFSNQKKSFLTTINLTVVGIVCVAILMTSVFFSSYIYRNSQQQAMQTLQQELEQFNRQMNNYIDEMYTLTDQLASDTQLGISVDQYYSDNMEESLEGKQMMDYIVQRTMRLNRMIDNITICTDEGAIQYNYYSMVKGNDIAVMQKEPWYRELLDEKQINVFTKNTSYHKTSEDETYFLWATKFKTTLYPDRREESRVLVVTFRMSQIRELMENIGKTKNINLLLYYLPDNSMLNQVIVDEEQLGKAEIDWQKEQEDFIVLDYDNQDTRLRLVGLMEKAAFFETIEFVQPWLWGVAIVMLVITTAISIRIFNNISRPMKTVVEGLDTMESTGFRKLEVDTVYRETEQLVHTYNQMTERIQELIQNIELKETEKRKEEYRVLEAQINPHFIYNTLDAIRWMALINHSKPTAEIISSFVKFLRLTLSKGKEMIFVSEEIELTKEYINLMVFRNNYDIHVEYVLDENVKDVLTLKLILQPFVENCFLHAFEHGVKDKKIVIRTMREDQNLIMEIEDNGKGFAGESPKESEYMPTGVGIHNVSERIKIWHGESYGVEVIMLEKGTKIRIRQPLLEKGAYVYDSGNDNRR